MNTNVAFFLLVLVLSFACSDRKKERGTMHEARKGMVSADSLLAGVDTTSSTNPYNLKIENDPEKISFQASKDTLYRGDTLVLNFTSDSLLEVAVVKPNEDFYLLVSDQSEPDKTPLMKKDAFKKRKKLTIITNKTTAYPFKATATSNQRIFDQTGVYQFRLSENMHTNVGYLETRKIFYFDKKQ